MKALIDTNLAITYITGREDPYSEQTDRIMEMCSKDRFEGYLAFHSLSVIWYLMRKVPMSLRRKAIKKLCELLTLSGADNKTVLAANANTDFADFEDALQDCCAMTVYADYIVTANIKDYDCSIVQAVTPDEFLALFR